MTTTIGSLLRNAFIRALIPKYDQKVTTGEVSKNVKAGAIPNADTNGAALPATNNVGLPKEPTAREQHGGTLLESTEQTNNRAPPQ